MAEKYSMKDYAKKLCKAVEAYEYPAVTYDFQIGREVPHSNMSEVDRVIHSQLCSPHLSEVKDGLSNVVYWGMYRMGFRDTRVREFRKVTLHQLSCFSAVARDPRGADLVRIKKIGMPQFKTGMSLVSKIRAFLDPGCYPVLDKSIAEEFSQSNSFPPLSNLTFRKKSEWGKQASTYISITNGNEQVYEEWACWCRDTAKALNSYTYSPRKNLRAVDVERSIFHLADNNKTPEAWRLLQGPKTED